MAVRAPALAEGLDWLNNEPLAISELRGRYILLDFFTFGCINCLNNLLTVKKLHEQFGKELTVIGVHIGKFPHEKQLYGLQQALKRHAIEFAVVNDPQYRIADAYAVKGWPTTILIDNRGYLVKHVSGEQKLSEWSGRLSACGLSPTYTQQKSRSAEKKLLFPQKVLAMPDFLSIANTGCDEVWISDYDGTLKAMFAADKPMGMAYHEEQLYICESGAGQVKRIDLVSREERVVVRGLRNPFDLAVVEGKLAVALGGSHLINLYDLQHYKLVTSYGNKFEALRDGRADECQLAQPSGLSVMDESIYFVDAESSSLRKIEGGVVETLIGEGLFTYGDSSEAEILLQHPQGVCAGIVGDGCGGGRLFIADTFNNKVKAYFPDDNSMMTLLDGLNEPGGISKRGCELYIANTNAHEIVVFDLSKMEKRVMAFTFSEDIEN